MPGQKTVYEDVFAPMYDAWLSRARASDINDEQFFLEEARRDGGPVLELGCGTGRITFPIAESGVSIIGLDIAPAMLDIARGKAQRNPNRNAQSTRFIEGDMSTFSLGQRFPLILIPYTGFMHLLTTEVHQRALKCIAEHLAENGRLIFATHLLSEDVLNMAEAPLESTIAAIAEDLHPANGNRLVLWNGLHYDPNNSRLEQIFRVEELDADGVFHNVRECELNQYHFGPDEVQSLLTRCGYRIEVVYGDYRRGPVQSSGERIWVTRYCG